jgi:hypothetical protein
MQQYAKAAKELLDNVAKLTIRQDAGQPRPPAPILLQASASPAQVPTRPTVPIEARISRFKQELLASRINLDELRRLAFQGIPDKDGLRAMTWKVGVVSWCRAQQRRWCGEVGPNRGVQHKLPSSCLQHTVAG